MAAKVLPTGDKDPAATRPETEAGAAGPIGLNRFGEGLQGIIACFGDCIAGVPEGNFAPYKTLDGET